MTGQQELFNIGPDGCGLAMPYNETLFAYHLLSLQFAYSHTFVSEFPFTAGVHFVSFKVLWGTYVRQRSSGREHRRPRGIELSTYKALHANP